jgi:hypothetical protein
LNHEGRKEENQEENKENLVKNFKEFLRVLLFSLSSFVVKGLSLVLHGSKTSPPANGQNEEGGGRF